VVTAVVGFSLQDVLGNVMGGLALNLDHSIRPGDWVKFNDMSGIVREIGWRQTSIESREGDMYIVPNSQLMKNAVMLQGARANGPEAAAANDRVPGRPSLLAVARDGGRDRGTAAAEDRRRRGGARTSRDLHQIRDGMAIYGARFWLTDLERDLTTDTAVRARVAAGLERAQLPIGIPRSELHLQRERVENSRVLAQLQKRALEAISRVEMFTALTQAERAELSVVCGSCRSRRARRSSCRESRGSTRHPLPRSADVSVSVEGGTPSTIATLEAPDFCGEFGMLTGERRQANVTAASEVDAWRLAKEDFQEILAQRPEICEEISRVLAERVVALRAARDNLTSRRESRWWQASTARSVSGSSGFRAG